MKKDPKLQAEAKAQFFEYGRKLGTREVFLDYVWNIVFGASMGYSFSQLHSYSYSIIALQELNLNFYYPRVYWNCACLSCEAIGLKDNEDKSSATDYGEIAKAIYKMKQSGIEVSPPSINQSGADFTPIESTNSILFGLGGISGINVDIAQQIIDNRPYTSFKHFYKIHAYKGSLVTRTKFIQLIKAGCFDEFEKDRIKVMKQFITYSTPKKTTLILANMDEILSTNIQIPKSLVLPYRFKKYVCSQKFLYANHPKFKSKKLYIVDQTATPYFNKHCLNILQKDVDYFYQDDMIIVVDTSLDKFFKPSIEQLKQYNNTPEFIQEFRRVSLIKEYNQTIPNQDINHWSFEACSFYSDKHELSHLKNNLYTITPFEQLPDLPQFVTKQMGNREWKQYALAQIAGTILSRNDNHHTVTLLDFHNNVIQCKFNGDTYAYYKQQISGDGNVVDPSWLKRGQCVIFTGVKISPTDFRIKNYKSSVFGHKVQKILSIDDNGIIETQGMRYSVE